MTRWEGMTPEQKKATKVRAAAWSKANPEKRGVISRRRNYKDNGVDPVAAEAARSAHDGVCACCGQTAPGGRSNSWHVDHNHATGRIRGVLCFQCNVGIGKLGDTLEGVLRAVRYLERNPQ